MSYPERYELVFQAPAATRSDAVTVRRTEFKGAGGHPVYMDETGIVRAEISDRGEIRMLPSGGRQAPRAPVAMRPVVPAAPEPRPEAQTGPGARPHGVSNAEPPA